MFVLTIQIHCCAIEDVQVLKATEVKKYIQLFTISLASSIWFNTVKSSIIKFMHWYKDAQEKWELMKYDQGSRGGETYC